MKRIALLAVTAVTAVIAATSFGAAPSHAAATLGKRHLSTSVITSDSSPMTLFTNRGHQTSSALTGAAGRFGTPTTPSGDPLPRNLPARSEWYARWLHQPLHGRVSPGGELIAGSAGLKNGGPENGGPKNGGPAGPPFCFGQAPVTAEVCHSDATNSR